MKYDKDTMNSLQEAYASVNEVKYYSGKDRNKKTGNPKELKNQTSKTSNKKPKSSMPTGGDGTAYMGEEKVSKDHPNHPDKHEDHPEMTYKDAAKIRGEKKTAKKQVELGIKSKFTDKYYPEKEGLKPAVANKKVAFKRKRIDEAIKMTKKEYAKTHKDFKSDDPKNPRVTRYVPGKGTVSTPVEIIDESDKKKEMEDKMKEVEDMRSLPTRMNLIKTKLRAMGLNMSHQLKGKELSEVIDYTLTERTRYQKEMGIGKGGTAKNDLAFQKVMRDHQDERMGANQKKKKRGAKTDEGTGKFTKMLARKRQQQAKNDALDAEARKAGYKNTQDFVNVQAVRKGGLGGT